MAPHTPSVPEIIDLASIERCIRSRRVGILFLDRDLCIKRFIPRIGEYFSIKTRDHDRSIGDVTHSLDYLTLEADARRVFAEGKAVEREATSHDGRWFMVRLAPYQLGKVAAIEGVVITFVDVTPLKRAESALRRSESQLANELKIMRRLHDTTLVAATAPKLRTAKAAHRLASRFGRVVLEGLRKHGAGGRMGFRARVSLPLDVQD